jgi:hypothetical protein
VTLPNDDVAEDLQRHFVLAHKNIERELHVGLSHGYKPTDSAVGTTNGAGGRNVQFVVLAADETVLHVLPGFWHPEDLVEELRLARELHALHLDASKQADVKQRLCAAMHQAHARRHGTAAMPRSDWQSFDRAHELQRAQWQLANEVTLRDTVVQDAVGDLSLKTIPEIVHERLAAQPFRRFDEFDMNAFVDYGRAHYDNNGGGKPFPRAEQANKKRAREVQKAERERERSQR